eukprot:CAMPEP_0201524536 /NCGR_PEP_ID=MMETSP0161_2-20130828/23152_1 /ASSEMBLY_ACC=CAM_ASM_000251 /TAXON_ID=180227 /ORGANISM="Neoparamoeba aestuarina, Strain SoJaBio B1-5/56/2" /LENGTH=459 /DNA_ID=CAMNT_0047923993 /DNA_START=49 /DNA_END=1428 /DNA_ORIENTATION=+
MKVSVLLCLAVVLGAVVCQQSVELGLWKDPPKNLHLAFTNSIYEMVISYHTKQSTDVTRCWYYNADTGTPLDNKTQDGTERFYDGWKHGYNHDVKIVGLDADTTYGYKCGDENIQSDWYEFRTRKEEISSFTFGVYGDMGVDRANDTVASVNTVYKTNDWSFVFHIGDISYADDHVNFEGVWNEFFANMQPVMSNIAYMVCPGNHEKYSSDPLIHKGANNFTAYEQKFRMPGLESVGVATNSFYSFDFGPVHIISINTEASFTGYPVDPLPQNATHEEIEEPSPEDETEYLQMNWLVEDLQKATANRANVPWIIVGGHRPVYEVNLQQDGVPVKTSSKLQAWLEPLFSEYEVDLYLAGHVHHYTRNWPVYMNEVSQKSYDNPKDTTYLIVGGAGNIEGNDGIDGSESGDTPDWFAFGSKAKTYSDITIVNSTTLDFKLYESGTNKVLDQITLTREAGRS